MTHKVTADIIQRRGLFSLYIRIHYRSHDSRVMTNDQKIKNKNKNKTTRCRDTQRLSRDGSTWKKSL